MSASVLIVVDPSKRWLVAECEGGVNNPAGRARGKMQLLHALVVSAGQLGQGTIELLLPGQGPVDCGGDAFLFARRGGGPRPEPARGEVRLNLGVDDLVDRAEVRA